MTPFKPIAETAEAISNLDPAVDDGDLLEELIDLAGRAHRIVPDLVGVSIALLRRGLTFTLVASSPEIAVLDAVQYLAGGPCVEAAYSNTVMDYDVLDEERWRLFAEATAARAVLSTLTLPVLSDGRVGGTVNLYAGSRRAFDEHHQQLADVFGAWAPGAVANADLSFTTRDAARQAPRRVSNQHLLDVATGIVAAELGTDVATAATRLREAAVRAGVTLFQLAKDIVGTGRWLGSDS